MSDSPSAPESLVLHEELMLLLARAQARRQPGVPTKIPSLAMAIKLSPASVYAYFSGSTVPSARALDDILTALDVRRPDERRRFGQLRDEAIIARKRGRRSPRDLPVPGNLPARSATFVGRDVARLTRLVGTHGQVAIHGEGGTGKSEFALQYAHAYQQRYPRRMVWWLDGGSLRQITAGLAELARRTHQKALRRDTVAAEWAMNWLRSNQQWLVVLDNVTRLEDAIGLLTELRDCGGVVLTTRLNPGAPEWRRAGLHPLSLGVLDRADSVALLLARTESADRAGARLLAQEAGDLPLALSQAAAFVTQHPGIGFREYRQQLADELDRAAASAGADGRSGRTIAATWTIAMRRACAAAPLSADIMSVLAYLAGMPLPEPVLETLGEPADVTRALDALAAYRVIDRDGSGLTAHRLVQAAARMADPRPAAHRATAVALLERAIPPDPLVNTAGWPRWRALTPHIEALTARLPAAEQSACSLCLRERFATFLQGQGDVTRTIALLESVAADAERILGRPDPDTRDYTANLALAYVAAARISPALAILDDLVPRYLEALGPADSETLMMRAVLADAYRLRGHPDLAADLLEQVIADAEGTDLDVETTQTNLAAAYTDAGRLDDAIALLQRVYAEQCRSLGDKHQKTLISRHNLARARREAGQADAAMAEFLEILAIQSDTFGMKHPHTLTTRGNLALTEQAKGQVDNAIAHFDALLVDTQEALGREHPATLTTLRYLAGAHLANGEADQAISLLERAVAEHRGLLGDVEPLTFLARRDLAAAYRQAASSLHDALLRDQELVLGLQHPAPSTVPAR
jgi:tetratricopeptide (TPR) repeat protein